MRDLAPLRPTLVIVGLALVGPVGQASGQAVRDSARVQIVENARATLPAARAWRIDPEIC